MLEKLLESPLDSRSSNQSTLKEINPEYSLEGLMLKLNHQYFGQLIQKVDSLKKCKTSTTLSLTLGKIEGRWRRGKQRIRLDDIIDSMDMSLSKLQEVVKDRYAWHAAVYWVAKSWTRLSD